MYSSDSALPEFDEYCTTMPDLGIHFNRITYILVLLIIIYMYFVFNFKYKIMLFCTLYKQYYSI